MIYEDDEMDKLKEIIKKKDNEIKELKENEDNIKEELFKCNALLEILHDFIVDIKDFNIIKNDINYYRKLVYYYILLEEEFEPLYYYLIENQKIYCTEEEFYQENEA